MPTSILDSRARIQCEKCTETFNRQSSLTRHYYVKHSDAFEVFKCSQCPKILSRKDLVLRHERLHQGDGLRSCPSCSRAVRSDYLPKHVRTCLRKAEKSIRDTVREPDLVASGSRNARMSAFAGNLHWQDAWCNAPEQEDSGRNHPGPAISTGRQVNQPARFVMTPTNMRHRRRRESGPRAVQETSAVRVLEAPPAEFRPPRKAVSCTELIDAIMQDDEEILHSEIGRLEDEGLTIADINELGTAESTGGLPLIMLAAWEGRVTTLQHLILRGVNVNMSGHLGWTALHCACYNGELISAHLLFNAGAHIDATMEAQVDDLPRQITPLWLAVEKSDNVLTRFLIEEMGADVDGGPETNGPSPLQCACRNNNIEAALLLIENGADCEGKSGSPSPLDEAVRHCSLSIIERLKLRDDSKRQEAMRLVSIAITKRPKPQGGSEQQDRILDEAANPYLQEAKRWFPAAF